MTMDPSLIIIADILSGVAVFLMIFIIKTTVRHEKRIQRMENDLYVDSSNPTSMPLTKQVKNLQNDVVSIKEHCEKFDKKLEKINKMVTQFYNSNFKK